MRAQIFSLDFIISVMIFLLAIPFSIYMSYQSGFENVHFRKIGVVTYKYYIQGNEITYICLARVDPNSGRVLPNYIDINNSIMWAVINYTQTHNVAKSLTYFCAKEFGTDYVKVCINEFLPLFKICSIQYLDNDWIVTDRFGNVIFMSGAFLEDYFGLPPSVYVTKNKEEKRALFLAKLCVSDAFQRYMYGYGDHIKLGSMNCDYFFLNKKYVIFIPFVGIVKEHGPVDFLLINNSSSDLSKYLYTNVKNVNPYLTTGLISSDFLLFKITEGKNLPPELKGATIINIQHTKDFPIPFPFVKARSYSWITCIKNKEKVTEIFKQRLYYYYKYNSTLQNLITGDIDYVTNSRCKNWPNGRLELKSEIYGNYKISEINGTILTDFGNPRTIYGSFYVVLFPEF